MLDAARNTHAIRACNRSRQNHLSLLKQVATGGFCRLQSILRSPPLQVLLILTSLLLSFYFSEAHAQGISRSTWEVYLQRNITPDGLDRLIFIDVLLAEQVRVDVYGERYTVLGNTVLYYDYRTGTVMQATAAGTILPHPFIRTQSADDVRVDWIVSRDGRQVAWTITHDEGDQYLSTTTFVADVGGSNRKQVIVDGPRQGIRALPVAFSPDRGTLYMDAQPDGLAQFTAYPQYAGLFAVDITSGQARSLPGEPGCFCGGGFGGDWFLRMTLPNDLSGFDLTIHNLRTETVETLPALRLLNYDQAGGVMVTPDGSRAVYTLAQVDNLGMDDQFIQTVFVLVDLNTLEQIDLTRPLPQYLQPRGWTEDNTALLLTSPQENGTWKLPLAQDARLQQVAVATYIGRLGTNSDS